jgi:dTDP-L-rhamnose 4-epimerase
MKVLVTGGAGFIGSHLVDLLMESGAAVTVIDNLDPQVHGPNATEPHYLARHTRDGSLRFVHGDVTERSRLADALEGADAVVHLAAAVGVGQSMYRPHYYVHTNACGTGTLLDLLVQMPRRVQKLVVASSMSLYGEGAYRCPGCGAHEGRPRSNKRLRENRWEVECAVCGADMLPAPTPETKAPEIASVYAATKKHQEDLAVSFGRAYSLPTFALRFFNVFGPRQSLANPYTGVAAIFLSRLLNGEAPLVFEDGRQTRDFLDVRDAARALFLALESKEGGTHVLNIGTGKPTAIADVAEALAASLALDVKPTLLRQFRAGDIRHCYADPSRAATILGFQTAYSLREGLPDLIAWCRGQQPPDRTPRSLDELRDRGLVG